MITATCTAAILLSTKFMKVTRLTCIAFENGVPIERRISEERDDFANNGITVISSSKKIISRELLPGHPELGHSSPVGHPSSAQGQIPEEFAIPQEDRQ